MKQALAQKRLTAVLCYLLWSAKNVKGREGGARQLG